MAKHGGIVYWNGSGGEDEGAEMRKEGGRGSATSKGGAENAVSKK
jgi:hypothetical protein